MTRRMWGVLVLLAFVFPNAAHAQQQRGAISAEVVNAETKAPVVGVQVFVVGTEIGALTNAQGRVLLLNVPAGARVVRVQMVGFSAADQPVTVTAGGAHAVRFELKQEAIALPSVVVTALGVQREQKTVGYAVQSVGQVAIERSPEVNLINALAGQSAGVSIQSSSGQPGASSRIVIRGESSFQGGGQPLFVVDGIPISVDLDSRNQTTMEFGEAGSRAMDIDPNNIAEISVLRGAAATALYGSRAAFGAIVIRTKQGAPGQRAQFTVSSSVGVESPLLGGKQLVYAQGSDGYFCNGVLREQGGWCQPGFPGTNPNPQSNTQWGPHRDSIPQIVLDSLGELRFRDPRRDFYKNTVTLNNSVTITGSLPTGAGSYNFTVSKLDQPGIMPATKLDRTNIGTNLSVRLSNSLRSTTSVQYSNADNIMGAEGYSSLTRTLYQLPMTRDIRQAWMPDGSPVMWGSNTPHPVWQLENGYNRSNTARWIAGQTVQLTLLPGVSLRNTLGLDTYVDDRRSGANERPWRTVGGQTSGSTSQEKITRRNLSNDLILNVDNQRLERFGIGDVSIGGLVGVNVLSNENSRIALSGTDIALPDNYNCENFVTCSRSGSLASMRRLVGVYAQSTIDYRDWAFLTLTGRNDWSSTLPKHNNNYFYPSAALSVVFTDMLGLVDNRWLQYGKARVSFAQVGSDAPQYRLDTRYGTASGPAANNAQQQSACCSLSFPIPQQNGINAFIQSSSLGNPDLKPESTREYEFGLELRGINGRARADISYYDKKSFDQIFSVPSSPSTGYTSITRNAGNLRNQGWEVTLNTVPIRTANRDIELSLTTNFTKNRSSVISLAEGVTSIFLYGYSWPQIRIMEGYEYGVIWGYGFKHNDRDPSTGQLAVANAPEGALLIDDTGWPILHDQLKVLGGTQPDWEGNLNTTLRFKSLELSALVQRLQGGDMLNFDLQYTMVPGQAKQTEKRGDTFVFDGYNTSSGQKNAVELERTRAFWARYGAFDTHENMVESKTHTRLREVSLTWTLPTQLTGRVGLNRNTRVFVSGRNLKVWSPNSKGDPEGAVSGANNAGGQSYSFFAAPQTRGWSFGLRTGF